MTIKYFEVKNPSIKFDFDDLMKRNFRDNAAPYTLRFVAIYDINNTAVIFENLSGKSETVIIIGEDESITSAVGELEKKLNIELEERD